MLKCDLVDLTGNGHIIQGHRFVSLERNGDILRAAVMQVSYGWSELDLRVIWPLEAHRVTEAVVTHREGELTWIADVTITKLDQVGWSGCWE